MLKIRRHGYEKTTETADNPIITSATPICKSLRPIFIMNRLLFAAATTLPIAKGVIASPDEIADFSNPVCHVTERTKKNTRKCCEIN